MSGSGTLVRALVADGLVDELHLFVYPVTRSAGPRLFDESLPPPPGTGRTQSSTTRGDLPEADPRVVNTAAVAAFARLGDARG